MNVLVSSGPTARAVSRPRFLSTLLKLAGLGFALTVGLAGSPPASAVERGKVLVVMSGAHQLELRDGKAYDTGYYLDELTIPVRKLIQAGFTPVYASPDGAAPSYDKVSNDKMFFGNDEQARAAALKFVTDNRELQRPKKLSAVAKEGTKEYVAIFIPGGHAPMQDLVDNKDLGKILQTFHDTQRPTGIICHGPTALLSALPDPSAFRKAMVAGDFFAANKLSAGWPYAGYRLTVFSSGEEKFIEGPKGQLGGYVQFYAADALAEAGAHVDRVAAFHPSVVEDRELLSGQQPFSSDAFGDAFVAKLKSFTLQQ